MVDDGPETDHLPFFQPLERTTGFDDQIRINKRRHWERLLPKACAKLNSSFQLA